MNSKITVLEESLNKSSEDWLKESLILVTRTGSVAYGTDVEGSDEDFMAVSIPPEDYFIGLKKWDGYDSNSSKNLYTDAGVKVIHITKFIKRLMDGVPNYMEMLFVEFGNIVDVTNIGKNLLKNKELFITKKFVEKLLAYSKSESYGLLKSSRKELIKEYGYDTKRFANSVRLSRVALEVMETGQFSVYREDREELKGMIKGLYTLEEATLKLKRLHGKVEEELSRTLLPEDVPEELGNNLLKDMVRKTII